MNVSTAGAVAYIDGSVLNEGKSGWGFSARVRGRSLLSRMESVDLRPQL